MGLNLTTSVVHALGPSLAAGIVQSTGGALIGGLVKCLGAEFIGALVVRLGVMLNIRLVRVIVVFGGWDWGAGAGAESVCEGKGGVGFQNRDRSQDLQ